MPLAEAPERARSAVGKVSSPSFAFFYAADARERHGLGPTIRNTTRQRPKTAQAVDGLDRLDRLDRLCEASRDHWHSPVGLEETVAAVFPSRG